MSEIIDIRRAKIIDAVKTAPDDEALSKYLMQASQVMNPTRFQSKAVTMREAIFELLSETQSPFALKLKAAPFRELSEFFFLTTGLHVIGAMSGHGKTFWAMEWAKEAAEQGYDVLVVSLEMTPKDLSARTLAQISDLPLMRIIMRDFDDGERQVLEGFLEDSRFEYLNRIHIETFGDYDWKKIYPRLWDRMTQLRPKLVIVDYVQMISNAEEDERMSKVLGDIARELKLFADQTESAALLLSQVNRDAAKEIKSRRIGEGDFIPLSHSHIKESGGIVEAADSVQMVCIPARLDSPPYHLRGKFQLTIQKSRRIGLLGTKLFDFDPEAMKFV